MQSDVPPLPISCLTDNIRSQRNTSLKTRLQRNIVQDKKNNSICKNNHNPLLSTNRKPLRSIIAISSPYKNSARFNPPDTAKSSGKSTISQRVSSAKMLRIKQLQNQLADAHFHLNELSNENKLLKAIQKRQDTALKRYEGTNAELPRIINSHQEDLRVLQTKYKKLKSQYKEISDNLKEKENELHSLQMQNKKLLQLSKDRHLGEREKLQTQVSDLNHRINQQDETIQTLKRKLTLDTKYLKHQLRVEMVKHKETQKELQDTQLKLKSLEELSEQREKRSYQSRVLFFNKGRPTITSQSLTNLNETKERVISGESFRRRRSEAAGQSLPALSGVTSLIRSQSHEVPQTSSQESSTNVTETLMNFEQIKHFRLQKSPASYRPAPFSTSRGSVRESPIKESQLEESDSKENYSESNLHLGNIKKKYELPKELRKEFNYPSDDEKSSDELESNTDNNGDTFSLTNRSRLLHARLINSASEGERTNNNQILNRSQSLTKENVENIIDNDREIKYDRDSVITVISRDKLKYDSEIATNYGCSDFDSDVELSVAFNADEDENEIRKSDIIIEDSEINEDLNTSSNYSKLFTQFYKASENSVISKDDNDKTELTKSNGISDKKEFESINGLLVHNKLVTDNADDFIMNDLITQKNVPKENTFKTPWDENVNEEPVLDQDINSDQETVIKNEKKNLIYSSSSDLQESESEVNIKHEKSNKESSHDRSKESDSKLITEKTGNENFDKAKLLAAMKAIDNNENIEFIEQKSRRNSGANRLQITENLYRGVPTHSRKKSDIMKELFTDTKLDNNKNRKEN